eukprot:c51556_g1_i1 orf=139-327(+)
MCHLLQTLKNYSAASNLSSYASTRLLKIIVEKRISVWSSAILQDLEFLKPNKNILLFSSSRR